MAARRSHAVNGRIGAHVSWSRTEDRTARTAPAREAFLARFEREVDPDGVLSPAERRTRAEHAKRAYMQRLAKSSARTRAKNAAGSQRVRAVGQSSDAPVRGGRRIGGDLSKSSTVSGGPATRTAADRGAPLSTTAAHDSQQAGGRGARSRQSTDLHPPSFQGSPVDVRPSRLRSA